jgi:hypothetical protein
MMRAMRALIPLPLLLACGGSSSPATPPQPRPAAGAPPALAAVAVQQELGWLAGRWEAEAGIEHWTAAGDALFGASFTVEGSATVQYEALIITAVDGKPVYQASPSGTPPTRFPLQRSGGQAVVFALPDHDPMSIAYHRNGDKLFAEVHPIGDMLPLKLTWRLGAAGRAPELEATDRAWSDAVAARGVDAWVEGFDPEGVQLTNAGTLITDAAERRKVMEPVLAGSFRLLWQPVASGWSPARDLGYTVGTWRYLAGNDEKGRGAYMTIWRRQPDGSYKALWDGGDPQE